MNDLIKDLRFWNGGIDSDKKMQKAADRIETLETNIELQLKWYLSNKRRLKARIEQLEAALEKIAQHDMQAIAMDALRPGKRIRKALDGKNDE